MRSGNHVSVHEGDDSQQKICCLKNLPPFQLITDPQPSIFSGLQGFLRVLQHPLSFDLRVYRFKGMIQRYRRKAFLCLLNYKRATAEFFMCTHLDACMAVHTCLGDVQRAIWRSWYDPVQRTMVFVKSALTDLDIHGKVVFSESSPKLETTELQLQYTSPSIIKAVISIQSPPSIMTLQIVFIVDFTQCPLSLFSQRGSAAGLQRSLVFGMGLCARQQT